MMFAICMFIHITYNIIFIFNIIYFNKNNKYNIINYQFDNQFDYQSDYQMICLE